MYLIFSFFCVLFLFVQNIRDKKIISNFSHSETHNFIIPWHSGDDHQLSVYMYKIAFFKLWKYVLIVVV